MENQTSFDLNQALTQWRDEFKRQPHLSAEQIRELESHLHDSLAELQQRGLNAEEAFWLACRRFGASQSFAEEMAKVDASRIWTERVFWMVLGVIVTNLWLNLAHVIYQIFVPREYYRSTFGLWRFTCDGVSCL
jgi:hypothetical protein